MKTFAKRNFQIIYLCFQNSKSVIGIRYKFISVTGIQITVYVLKNTFRTSFVGIGKRAAAYLEGYADMRQFVSAKREVVISRKESKHLMTA